MDGLEYSEISIKDINKKLFRIEAEYFQKKYIILENILKKYNTLSEYKKEITCGPFGSNLLDTEYKDSGILVVRPFNLVDGTIENERLVYISEETIKNNGLKLFSKGTVLFSRVGDIKVGYSNRNKYTISPNIIVTNFNDDSFAKYCSVFFNTKYGHLQIERQLKVAAQPTISTEIISKLKLPVFSKLSSCISTIVNNSEEMIIKSEKRYKEANNLLSNALQIKLQSHTELAVSVKRISEIFGTVSRLDAEYYQPKYDTLFKTLKNFNCESLGGENGLCKFKKSIEPGSDAYQDSGIPFVRVGDIDKYGIAQPRIHLSSDIVDNVNELFPEKDTILLSKDGSVCIAYKVREEMGVITSGALLHLMVKNKNKILPDYLTLILNSPIVQLQAERDTNGAIIQHWKPSEIEKVIIPLLDMDTQHEIASKVQESFKLRSESKQLLEYAKQAVEMAIEQNEDVAIKWLDEKVKTYGDR